MRLAGEVPLPETPLPPSEHVLATLVVQSGRIRVTHLLDQGLTWELGQPLQAARIRLGTGQGALPAILVSPGEGGRMRVNSEQRLSIPSTDRSHLGISADRSEVLLAMRITDPTKVLMVGAPALSLLLRMLWTDEVR